LSQDHPAPVVCKNNIIPPSAPNQNTKDMQFVFFVSDTAISICVCELQKKTHHHYQNVSPETGPDSIMGGFGF